MTGLPFPSALSHTACRTLCLGQPYHQNLANPALLQSSQSIPIWEKLSKWSEMGTASLRFSKKYWNSSQGLAWPQWQHKALYPSDFKDRRGGKGTCVLGKNVFGGDWEVQIGEEREGSGCLVLSAFVLPPFPGFLVQCFFSAFSLWVTEIKMINAQIWPCLPSGTAL